MLDDAEKGGGESTSDRDGGGGSISGVGIEDRIPSDEVVRLLDEISALPMAPPRDGHFAARGGGQFDDLRRDTDVGDAANVTVVVLGEDEIAVGGEGDGARLADLQEIGVGQGLTVSVVDLVAVAPVEIPWVSTNQTWLAR